MASIKTIRFDRSDRNNGCICDQCGQYITNIWTVGFSDGITMHFGIDCFDKLKRTSNLTDLGRKRFNKALKHMQKVCDGLATEKSLTAETDVRYQELQNPPKWSYYYDNPWDGKPWEEYHEWMVNVWWKARVDEAQKEIDRFRNANFQR